MTTDTRIAMNGNTRSGALAAMREGPSQDEIELIKKTVAKGASDLELQLFLHQCKRTGLDPLARQIYWIKRGDGGTIQTGIDGYRLMADRTGQYAGNDEPVYTGSGDHPATATVTVWKLVGGLRCGFSATARWGEYSGQSGPMWKKMPYLMLGKVAEALALRKAFPADLSGIYTDEEMDQAQPATPEREPRQTPPQRSQATATPPATPGGHLVKAALEAGAVEMASHALLTQIATEGKAIGYEREDITALCLQRYERKGSQLTQDQAQDLLAYIRTMAAFDAPDAPVEEAAPAE